LSCKKDASIPAPLPNFDMKGKWLWSYSENRSDANTMYEFADGTIYTSYATNNSDFSALDSSDRIPGSETYTFDGNTLIWDETSLGVTFECDGGKSLFSNGNKLWRLSSDCE
jgi:hypothetical protein